MNDCISYCIIVLNIIALVFGLFTPEYFACCILLVPAAGYIYASFCFYDPAIQPDALAVSTYHHHATCMSVRTDDADQ